MTDKPLFLCGRWSYVLLLTVVACSTAAASAGDNKVPQIFDTAYLIQVFGSLLLVFACLLGLAFLLKKINGLPLNDRKSIQVLGSVKVGSREKVLLVTAGDQQLLLGVAAGSVRTLFVFGESEVELPETGSPGPGNFASLLKSPVSAREKR